MQHTKFVMDLLVGLGASTFATTSQQVQVTCMARFSWTRWICGHFTWECSRSCRRIGGMAPNLVLKYKPVPETRLHLVFNIPAGLTSYHDGPIWDRLHPMNNIQPNLDGSIKILKLTHEILTMTPKKILTSSPVEKLKYKL